VFLIFEGKIIGAAFLWGNYVITLSLFYPSVAEVLNIFKDIAMGGPSVVYVRLTFKLKD
jgi:hypothetical protein